MGVTLQTFELYLYEYSYTMSPLHRIAHLVTKHARYLFACLFWLIKVFLLIYITIRYTKMLIKNNQQTRQKVVINFHTIIVNFKCKENPWIGSRDRMYTLFELPYFLAYWPPPRISHTIKIALKSLYSISLV